VRLLDVGELKFVGGAEMAAENGLHARFISGFRHPGIMEKTAQPGKREVRESQFANRSNGAETPCGGAACRRKSHHPSEPSYLISYSNELD
jgi:hypothetical protein